MLRDLLQTVQVLAVIGVCYALLSRFGAEWVRLADRRLQIEEDRAARGPGKQVALPLDIEAWVNREGEEWARDATRTWVRETYERVGNWDDVRKLALST